MTVDMEDAKSMNLFKDVKPGTITVLYMHGCSGLEQKGDNKWLSRNGFLVVAPNSLAKHPADCTGPGKTGLFPQAPAYRLREIKYALEQIRKLPSVDMNKLVLMGFSEGAKASANWSGTEFRAVLITGWRCATRDTFFEGLKVPKSIPVMNIVSDNDNWLVNNQGVTCEQLLKNHVASDPANSSETLLQRRVQPRDRRLHPAEHQVKGVHASHSVVHGLGKGGFG